MSLSKEIVEGNLTNVKTLLGKGAPVNVLDEYGYTPLIHAVGTNRADIVQLLLKQNATPDLVDITGSTALHWAVDNNNLEITELLLKYGADPNAYTDNGQPVLFYPLLRKNQELIQLLCKKGANIDFVKDFINAKLLGHRFELQGNTDIVTPSGLFLSIDLEGFYLEFTLSVICGSLEQFLNSFMAHRMDIHSDELKIIIDSFKNAFKLREFKHFSQNVEENKSKIYPLLDVDLLLLPVSYKGHAITLVKYHSLLAKCDRGVHKMTDPIVIYSIGNTKALDRYFFINLLYQRISEKYIKSDINKILALHTYAKLPIKHQITGNCSWANVEASVPTMLYMLLYDKTKDQEKTNALVTKIMQFYYTWLDWDKDRAIEDWLIDFEKISFARQKSKAALLGAVLFQGCRFNKPQDLIRAKRILRILSKKEFHYIVRIYANIFLGSRKSAQGLAFKKLIEMCGYQLSQFNY